MVYFPVRKCYQATKLVLLVVLVVSLLALFEQWRGGKKNTLAEYSDPLEAEYERQILEDEARIIPGLGEGGEAATLIGEEKMLGEESEKKLAINVYLSDRIAYNRTLKDYRNPACLRVVYDAELPSASVILIFHNEPYSVVVRTIWSVVNSVRRDQPWYTHANFVDRHTGKLTTAGYPGQDPNSQFVYLKEIILVDDNSTLPELKGKLSHYVRTRLPPDLIRILRLPERVGLTQARLAGARYAAGDVLVFLDSHCEPQPDWLRPLLQTIKKFPHAVVVPIIDVIEANNFYYSASLRDSAFQGLTLARLKGARSARGDVLVFLDAHCEPGADWMRPLLERVKHKRDAVLTPIIDVIDQSTFEFEAADTFQVGGFSFKGDFTWIDVPPREKKRRGSDIAPTWSPTMAGGLFAISRKYFWELGAYDEQMGGWGGENLEMSFRIWQCGGTLETIPCSRVGHVFRSFHPYGMPAHSDTHGINTARMAEVWMDEYAELFYLHRPDLRNNPKIGDVTHRKVLREKLNCKSFQWYLDNIFKEKFVPVRDVYGYGRFKNQQSGLCLDTMQRDTDGAALGCYPCHADLQATQYFSFSLAGELRDEFNCAAVRPLRATDEHSEVKLAVMTACRAEDREQKWRRLNTGQLQHIASRLCLTAAALAQGEARMMPCGSLDSEQLWTIDYTEDNDFHARDLRVDADLEKRLNRLRGLRRVSRSLLSYAEPEERPARRHAHKGKRNKHKRARPGRRRTKNKFILKIMRTLMNGTEEHLEVDIHCKHKRLFPNNSFVRDLVTILNDKNVKVINNGRIFERNKVTEMDTQKTWRVLNKLDIEQPSARGPPPAAPPASHQDVAPKKPGGMVRIEKSRDSERQRGAGRQRGADRQRESGRQRGSERQRGPQRQRGAEKPRDAEVPRGAEQPRGADEPRGLRGSANIIEDFLEMKRTVSTPAPDTQPPQPPQPPQHLRKRKHKHHAAHTLQKKLSQKLSEDKGSAPHASSEAAAGVRDGVYSEENQLDDSMDRSAGREDWPVGESRFRRLSHVPLQDNDINSRSGEKSPPAQGQQAGPLASDASSGGLAGAPAPRNDSRDHWHAAGAPAPVKVVMKSNLTFNLGDEYFEWKSKPSDELVNNFLGELAIPTNNSSELVRQPEALRGQAESPAPTALYSHSHSHSSQHSSHSGSSSESSGN